jgi:hypothetical protein
MNTSKQNCGNCKFSRPDIDGEDDTIMCHRYPPTLTPFLEECNKQAFHTSTQKTDWCGEWKGVKKDREK